MKLDVISVGYGASKYIINDKYKFETQNYNEFYNQFIECLLQNKLPVAQYINDHHKTAHSSFFEGLNRPEDLINTFKYWRQDIKPAYHKYYDCASTKSIEALKNTRYVGWGGFIR